MTAANPLKKFITWLNAEEDDVDLESAEMAAAPSADPKQKRQRGPLMLRSSSDGGMEIRHPRSLEERMAIGLDLKQRRTVALDLTHLPDTDARYFLEFVYGVVFALDATAEKVTEGIYLLAPRGVDVHNDVEEGEEVKPTRGRATRTARAEQEELFWQGS